MEKAKQEKEAHGEIETAHPGYLGAQDTCVSDSAVLTEVRQERCHLDNLKGLSEDKYFGCNEGFQKADVVQTNPLEDCTGS